jgi:hypothetical protein
MSLLKLNKSVRLFALATTFGLLYLGEDRKAYELTTEQGFADVKVR